MIDRFVVLFLGLLALALYVAALATTVNWVRVAVRVRRAWKWLRVGLAQMPDEDAEAIALIAAFTFVYGFLLVAR